MASTRTTILLTFFIFAIEPIPFGVWLAHIPTVMARIGLDKAELAIALLGMPIGVLTMLQFSGRILDRIGPRRILWGAFPAHALIVCLPLLSWSQIALFLALSIYGSLIALFVTALNVYAGRLEKEKGVTIMNRAHGFWAIGVMVGSALTPIFADVSAVTLALIVGGLAGVTGLLASLRLEKLAGDGERGVSTPRRRLRAMPVALAAISIATLAASMTEGAMADWAAVYLTGRLDGDAAHAGIAVTIYAGFLAAGRFLGDAATRAFGPARLARGALALAASGLLLLIVPLPLWLAYPGFALIGLGVSVGFPLGVSAVAALDDAHEGANIAILTSVTTLGFLIGPPMIGLLAESYGLRVGLASLLPILTLGFVCAGALGRKSRVTRA